MKNLLIFSFTLVFGVWSEAHGTPISLAVIDGPDFTGAKSSTASITATLEDERGQPLANGTQVTWTVIAAQNDSPAMARGWEGMKTGLKWGATAVANDNYARLKVELTFSIKTKVSGEDGKTMVKLTDIIGERSVTVQAHTDAGNATATVHFGKGPLSVFRTPPTETPIRFSNDSPITSATNPDTGFPAANHCGGRIAYTGDGHYPSSNLPSLAQFQAIAVNQWKDVDGNGAWAASGWSDNIIVWTDEILGNGEAAGITNWSAISGGIADGKIIPYDYAIVCLR